MSTSKTEPAWKAAQTRDWIAYYDRVAGGEPRQTLRDALDRFDAEEHRTHGLQAIDLGCGDGRDTAELLRRGWRVLAIDAHPEGLRRLRARTDAPVREALADGRLVIVQATFEDCELPACDLLSASFSLPFCPPEHFADLWARIRASVRSGGRFCGQLFGDRDSWSVIEDRTHHARREAIALFDDFLLEQFNEEERDGEDAQSNRKHWHVYHIIARKRV